MLKLGLLTSSELFRLLRSFLVVPDADADSPPPPPPSLSTSHILTFPALFCQMPGPWSLFSGHDT